MAQSMRIEDAMTLGCESIGEHESIQAAAEKMRRLNVGALPICGEDDELKGMVTDRDIVTEIVSEGLDPSRTEAAVLRGKTVCCHTDDDLDRAMELMSVQQIRRLPVLDQQDKLVGIISQADIAMYTDSSNSGDMLAKISEE